MLKATRLCRVQCLLWTLILFVLSITSQKVKGQELSSTTKTVTINETNSTLKSIFRIITKQTRLKFLGSSTIINLQEKQTINVTNATINDVLNILLKGKEVKWIIENGTIIIQRKDTPPLSAELHLKPKEKKTLLTVQGFIVNQNNEPINEANILLKGSYRGTKSNANGEFMINDVTPNSSIIISNVSYLSREISITNKGNIGQIKLQPFIETLDETVVIAYGKTSKRLTTGNTVTVKAKDIETNPVNNPLLALEGRVPGLEISQASGLPGSGVSVRIQGLNSISKGNDPLYIIDGVPYSSQLLPSISEVQGLSGPSGTIGNFGRQNGNPLNFINPDQIESIDILKDGDATAIYGSRAANGAILITTKKGKVGKTKVNLNIQRGWGEVTRKMDLLDTKEFIRLRLEAFMNDNVIPNESNAFDLLVWDTTRQTDWQKELIGGSSQYTNVNVSVSGGTTNTQYIIGSSYHKETTVFPGKFNDQKTSTFFSLNNSSSNNRLKVALTGSYLYDKNKLPQEDLTAKAILLAPNAPSIFNQDGTLNWAFNSAGGSTYYDNPLAPNYNTYDVSTNNLVSNASISYNILPGLDLKSSFGFTNLQSNEIKASRSIALAPEDQPFYPSSASYGNNNITSWIIEPQILYNHNLLKGKIDVLIGSTIQKNNNTGLQLTGENYTSDLVLEDIKSAADVTVTSNLISTYRYNAIFGRINYNLKDKYILNFTARRDGSSRFGSENRFHNFGSIGGAWIFSNSTFIQNNLSFLSFGKIRASYGITGNDQIGDYAYLNLFNPNSVSAPYQGIKTLTVNGIPNPYLKWEETKKAQFGLDAGFYNDRVLLSLNYYQNRSSNQLLPYTLPITTGFYSISAVNFPAKIKNYGWEFSLNTINIKGKLGWTTNINLTIPRNKLTDFTNLSTSSYANSLVIGEPINIVKLYKFAGVDPATGLYSFNDKNGNPLIQSPNSLRDKNTLINVNPEFYGGIQNTLSFHGFRLDLLLQFVKQTGKNYYFGNSPGNIRTNQPISVLDRWKHSGDYVSIQRANQSGAVILNSLNAQLSDRSYSDASYLRLKNFSFSWQVSPKIIKQALLDNARLYFQAQNLFTITRYIGLDPENKNISSLPPLRVCTFGIQAEF